MSMETRLRQVFRLALVAAVAPAAVGCGGRADGDVLQADAGGPDGSTPPDGGGLDGSTPRDGSTPPDAGGCALDAGVQVDAGAACEVAIRTCAPLAGDADGGAPSPDECKVLCLAATGSWGCSLAAPRGADGYATVYCHTCVVGRRPEGLVDVAKPLRADRAVGDYFAQTATLEAAAVGAFRVLREELRAHGAPATLVRAAERAERDEVRHAASMARLARRHGADRVEAPSVKPRSTGRSLEAIAEENVVEGCVRETFGALAATWQAQRAEDPVVAKVMRRIARDETRHAALSWRVARWALRRLDPAARARVLAARRRAVEELVVEVRPELPPSLSGVAGVPGGAVAERLARALDASLWS